MSKFSTWTHPTTGKVRVYISGFGATKVWAEQCEKDQFGFDYTIRATNQMRNRSELENIVNEAEREIFEAAKARIKDFDSVIGLAK